jgi:hypothetical protein
MKPKTLLGCGHMALVGLFAVLLTTITRKKIRKEPRDVH